MPADGSEEIDNSSNGNDADDSANDSEGSGNTSNGHTTDSGSSGGGSMGWFSLVLLGCLVRNRWQNS